MLAFWNRSSTRLTAVTVAVVSLLVTGQLLFSESPAQANLLTAEQHTFMGELQWAPEGNTTVSHVATPSYVDQGSLQIRVDESGPWPDDTGTARTGTLPGAQGVPVDPGTNLGGSVRVRAAGTPAGAHCEIRFYDDAGKGRELETAVGSMIAVSGDAWTQSACSGRAPDGAVTASLRVLLDDVDYGETYYADDAWLTAEGRAEPEPEPTSAPEPPPDPEPEPSPGPTSVAPVPNGGPWPGPASTGPRPGTKLASSGSITTTEKGQVIENVDVRGSITVRHSNVTIRNVRVRSTSRYAIHVPSGLDNQVKGLLIEDAELVGVSGSRSAGLVHYGQWTARRIEVRGFIDGVKMRGGQTLEDSWIHGLWRTSGSHNDGIQAIGGSGSVIRGNNIVNKHGQTSAVLIQTHSPISGWKIDGNRFEGGGYTVYLTDKTSGPPQDMTVVNNVWVRGSWRFGPLKIDEGPGLTWRGNTYDDGASFKQ